VRVCVIEEFDLNTAASGRTAGNLHGQIPVSQFRKGIEWAASYLPALQFWTDSLKIWASLSEELDADLEASQHGGLLIADDEEGADLVRRKVEFELAHGFESELLTGAELRQMAPYVTSNVIAAEYCVPEGRANPLLVVPAFARAAARRGAQIYARTAVDRIREVGGGYSVETSAGTVRTAAVVLATGDKLPMFAAEWGVKLPMEGWPVQVHATEPLAPVIPHLVYHAGGRLTLKQTESGAVLIGGSWPAMTDPHTGHPKPQLSSTRGNLRIARQVAPWLADVKVVRAWAGVGNVTPDARPIIGEMPGVKGVFLGMIPHMGFTGGPLLGQVLSSLVTGNPVGRDLNPFSPVRFGQPD
jgi:sarcosine oxidase, subunit beta